MVVACFHQYSSGDDFGRGFKLEAVNPKQPRQLCAATITRVVNHLLWIHLDNTTEAEANHVVPMTSHELFPVGWCECNDYPLRPPRVISMRKRYSREFSKM